MAEAAARGRTRAPDASGSVGTGHRPDDSFDELRTLLVGPEQRELRDLREYIHDPDGADTRGQPRAARCDRAARRRRAAHEGAGADRRGSDHVLGAAGSAPARRRALPRHRSGHPQGHRAHAGRDGGVAQSHRRAQLLVAGAAVALDGVPNRQAVRRDRPAQHAAVPGRAGVSDSRRDRPAAAAPLARSRARARTPIRCRRCSRRSGISRATRSASAAATASKASASAI